jgi:hypothetical protein
MPIFDIECKEHGKQEIMSSGTTMYCPVCEKEAKRLYSIDRMKITVDFTPGWDMGAGKVFNTKMERNNWLAEKNYRRVRG